MFSGIYMLVVTISGYDLAIDLISGSFWRKKGDYPK